MNEPNAVTKATLQYLFGEEEDGDGEKEDGGDGNSDDNGDHIDEPTRSCSNSLNEKTIPSQSQSQSQLQLQSQSQLQLLSHHSSLPPFVGDSLAQTRKRKSSFQRQQEDNSPSPPCNNSNGDSIDEWDQKIGIFDGILTRDECDELIAVHSSEAHGGYIDHLEVTRVSDLVASLHGLPLCLPLLKARYTLWETVEAFEFYPEAFLGLVPEYTALTAWHSGAFLRMHYDANKEYLLDRHYSVVLYLNDPDSDNNGGEQPQPQPQTNTQQYHHHHHHHHPSNYHKSGFSGGDLVFQVPSCSTATATAVTKRTKRIRPMAGRLVCFPSSSDYVHGVEEITRGTRYALTMWFTKHQSAMESLESLKQAHSCSWFCHDRFLIRTNNNTPASLLVLQQPWETPQQAKALRLRILERANLPKTPPPLLLQPSNQIDGRTNRNTRDSVHATTTTTTVTENELLHLVAHCWWKRGLPLGDLVISATIIIPAVEVAAESQAEESQAATEQEQTKDGNEKIVWTLQGGEEFRRIFHDWRDEYLPRRGRGLASALERWINHEGGLITNVRDCENEMK